MDLAGGFEGVNVGEGGFSEGGNLLGVAHAAAGNGGGLLAQGFVEETLGGFVEEGVEAAAFEAEGFVGLVEFAAVEFELLGGVVTGPDGGDGAGDGVNGFGEGEEVFGLVGRIGRIGRGVVGVAEVAEGFDDFEELAGEHGGGAFGDVAAGSFGDFDGVGSEVFGLGNAVAVVEPTGVGAETPGGEVFVVEGGDGVAAGRGHFGDDGGGFG